MVWKIRAETALGLTALAFVAASCSAAPGTPEPRPGGPSSPVALPKKSGDLGAKGAKSSTAAAPAGSAVPVLEERQPGRIALGEPLAISMEPSIEPVAGGRSVLFVAQAAGDRVAWARRFGGSANAMGPLLRFQDEYVLSAFEGDSGAPLTIVTSDGERLCLSTFPEGRDVPSERGCVKAGPFAIVPVGDRFALIEAEVERKPEPPKPAAKKPGAAPKKAEKVAPKPKAKPVKRKPPKASAKGGANDAKAAAKGGSQKPAKKTKTQTKTAAKKKPAKKPEARKPPSYDKVNVSVRFVSRAGAFEGEAVATGLSFDRPLAGLTLIDARGRQGNIDLAWFEAQPKRLTTAPMGSARVAAGTIRTEPAVAFDPSSRVPVLEGDLDYSGIAGHHGGRLLGTSAMTLFVGLTGRPGGCEVVRTAPSLSLLTPAASVCSIAPHKLADGGVSREEIAALEKIAGEKPQRTFGQPRHDPGLAAWAGDQAFFLRDGKLVRASAKDGEARESDPPFASKRSRIAWGSVHPDGEGIALVEGNLYGLNAQGTAAKVGGLQAPTKAAGANATSSAPPITAPERSGLDRRRLAKIGSSWWMARGDVVRVAPSVVEAPSLRGRAHPDTSVLAGGPSRGIFVEVSGGQLRSFAIDEAGQVSALGSIGSPVRAGLDAVPRAGGGAIVAGVSASNPEKIVAFALDDKNGHAFPAHETSLRVEAGELMVRLVALPSGGALLSDAGRRRVVWLDDDAREVSEAPWPSDDSGAICLDGVAGRLFVPAPVPGEMARIPELAAPGTCVVGDIAWAKDGSLRWFGSSVRGLHSIAEAGVVRPSFSASGSAAAPAFPQSSAAVPISMKTLPEPPCPADMVSIGGEYCIDRFEAILVDAPTGEALSPDYPTTPNLLEYILSDWSTGRSRMGDVHGKAMPLPFLPRWQRGAKIQMAAVSRMGVQPSGYLTGLVAESACAAAGKRLCVLEELTTACRGEDDTQFPYGDTYEEGACNVFREDHPAAILHGNASVGHLDPRLNRVRVKGEPLLRATGATPRCRSRWGADAVYDLVGNLDEWVDDEDGAFAGGFYSRSTRAGCDAVITSHPKNYLDYSTGVRCCRDAGENSVGP